MKSIYETPTITWIVLEATDIVRTSPGDNCVEDDFPAFVGN